MKRPIKTWAGEPLGNCWCKQKGVGIFKGHYYCNKHLKQEQYRDEQEYYESKESEDAQHLADYQAAVEPRGVR